MKRELRRWQCETCRHPDSAEIDRRLRAGETRAAIVREYGLPYWSVRYHWNRHLATETDSERETRRFTAQLGALISQTARDMARAERRGRRALYGRAYRLHKLYLELKARSLGIPARIPPPATFPLGKPRGGWLMRGGQRFGPESDPAPAPADWPPGPQRPESTDPYDELRRQRRETLRRLGIRD